MAAKTIDQLNAAAAALATQEFEVYDPAGTPKSQKVTGAQLQSLIYPPEANTGNHALTNGTGALFTVAHGLGVVPSRVRMVLVCTNTDSGLGTAIGDELDCPQCIVATPASVFQSFFCIANATNIKMYYSGVTAANTRIWLSTTTGLTPNSWTNFALKCYYHA